MRGVVAIAVLAAVLAACASSTARREDVPVRATDFTPNQIRQPVVFVRISFGVGQFSDEERTSMPPGLEGALLDELNARAVLAKEVQVSLADGARDPAPALARARELGADHAILVDVRVARGPAWFCQDTRRRFQTTATRWAQAVEVRRASDGAVRLSIAPASMTPVWDIDVDCDAPRDSRRLTPTEVLAESAKRLATRLVEE